MKKTETELFLEMRNIINEGKEEKIIEFIEKNQYLLKIDPILFIGNHISFYSEKEDIDKSLEVIEYYKTRPYISMEVEDFLNDLHKELSNLKNKTQKVYDDERIKKMLLSKNEDSLMCALNYLSKQNIRIYIPLIQEFLLSEIEYKYKTLALFILVEQGVSNDIKVLKNGRIFTYKPSTLTLPFEEELYKKCRSFIIGYDTKRVDITKVALELLNKVQVNTFPDSLLEEKDCLLLGEIFIDLAKSIMNDNPNFEKILDKYDYDPKDLEYKLLEINKILFEQ